MNWQQLVGIIAGFLALISFIPYFLSIFRGETKPERATFAIWSGVNLVTLISYFAAGGREAIWVIFVYTLLQIVIFALSFKYGVGGRNRLDIIVLVGAAIGVLLWIVTKDPRTALYLSVGAEFLGLVPTLKKSYLYPETENATAWAIAAVAAGLNIFAVTSLKPEIALYPIYLFLGDTAVALLLVLPRKAKGKNLQKDFS